VKRIDPDVDPIDRSRFPADPWRLVETEYSVEGLGATETLFALGNGYLGMRGNPEEGRDSFAHGTFINGFHETWNIRHAEEAFGFAKTGQTIVNVPDAKTMKLYVDDEPLLLSVADTAEYERSVDFRDGVLRRHVVWRTPAGKRVRIDSTRLVSFDERHLGLMTLEVELLDGDAPVVVSSQVLNRQDGRDEYHATPHARAAGFDPRKASKLADRVLLPQGDWGQDRRMILSYKCANSGMTLAVGVDHTIETENEHEVLTSTEPDIGKTVFRVQAQEGVPIRITKAVAYHSSRGVPVRELFDRCRRTLDRVARKGFEPVYTAQRAWLERYWKDSDVEILDHPDLTQATRWCIFQLAQAAARSDQMGVAAKGVSGSGYEGHYFWDTDVYLVPFLTYTNPTIARNLVKFRVNLLPAARERAWQLAQRGALYPWRTINGEEASAYYAAGTAQYHIDADVAFALYKYSDISGDCEFMYDYGIDVLVETARMWADLGFWRVNEDRTFHIHGVTGPDEYTTVVNNNLFTNVMAKANLQRAARLARQVRDTNKLAWERLVKRVHLEDAELDEWEQCADAMFIPFDERFGIHPQDEHFLERELWDLEATPPQMRPLLLHFHPLVIYRFQVLKQADVVLALFLQGDQFTTEAKRADFDYYDPITSGDSTLSAVVQSIVAAEVGYQELALRYFVEGLYVDLADTHQNTSDGVHIASAGGVWNGLVYGFAGMRDYDGEVSFDPRLPAAWPELSFPLRVHGTRFRVRLRQDSIEFTVEEGDGVRISVRGEQYDLVPGEPVRVELDGQGPILEGRKPEQEVVGEYRADGTLITAAVPHGDTPASPWSPGRRGVPSAD
jgi:alpha,alpha-trehalose phosphorylase